MRAYIIRRLILIIPTLLLVTLVVFFTVRLIPGDIIDQMLANQGPTQSEGSDMEFNKAKLRQMLGLDVPVHVQYVRWVGNLLRGDLGKSLWKDLPVRDELMRRFPVSFELGALAMVVGLVMAIPIGVYSAIRQDSIGDYVGRSIAIFFVAVPSFWLGTLIMVYPSIWWNWSPSMEYIPFAQNPLGNLGMFIIPAVILGMVLSGSTMRITRTMMLEVMRQDYIRTAWAKGLKERVLVIRHALKNALIPVITLVGLQVPVLVGGSVILESIFVLPGVGLLLVDTINRRDYPILSGINVFMAVFILLVNLLTDLAYGFLDPRIRYR